MGKTREQKLFLMEGIFFVAFCSLYAYVTSIMLEYGYNEVQCGVVGMLQYLVMMVAGPVYDQLIDRGLSPKKLFFVLTVCGMAATPLLPLAFSHGFGWTMLAVSVVSCLDFCCTNVIDTWVTLVIRRDPSVDYGKVRSAGSIFYAVTALISGYLMVPLGVKSLFIIHFVFLGLSLLLALKTEAPADLPEQAAEAGAVPGRNPRDVSLGEGLRVLFSNRDYVVFLVTGMLYYFATRAINTFMPIILENIGGDVSSYGLSVFLYCVGECIMLRIASRLLHRGVKMETLFVVTLLSLGIRLGLLGFLHNMTLVMVTQIFLSVAFGCFLRFNVEYVAGLFPPEYAGRAILISVAVTQGLGCIIGNLLGGFLIDGIGVSGYLYLCCGLLALALVIFLVTRKKKKSVPETA